MYKNLYFHVLAMKMWMSKFKIHTIYKCSKNEVFRFKSNKMCTDFCAQVPKMLTEVIKDYINEKRKCVQDLEDST